jgi:ribosomal protein L5
VVMWDRLARYPELSHVNEVPRISGVTLHWSLRWVGFNGESCLAAMTGLYRRTGHQARVHRSTASVSSWKLREGEMVGCSVSLGREEGLEFIDAWLTRVLPHQRSFEGRSSGRLEAHGEDRGSRGGVTIPIPNPRQFPSLEPRYERMHPRCSRPGLSITIHRGGFAASDKRTLGPAKSLLTGVGVPRSR